MADALASPSRYGLVKEADDDLFVDPRYAALLAAVAALHGPAAIPADCARAAFSVSRLGGASTLVFRWGEAGRGSGRSAGGLVPGRCC